MFSQIIVHWNLTVLCKCCQRLLLVQRIRYCIAELRAFFGIYGIQPAVILIQNRYNNILEVFSPVFRLQLSAFLVLCI